MKRKKKDKKKISPDQVKRAEKFIGEQKEIRDDVFAAAFLTYKDEADRMTPDTSKHEGYCQVISRLFEIYLAGMLPDELPTNELEIKLLFLLAFRKALTGKEKA